MTYELKRQLTRMARRAARLNVLAVDCLDEMQGLAQQLEDASRRNNSATGEVLKANTLAEQACAARFNAEREAERLHGTVMRAVSELRGWMSLVERCAPYVTRADLVDEIREALRRPPLADVDAPTPRTQAEEIDAGHVSNSRCEEWNERG